MKTLFRQLFIIILFLQITFKGNAQQDTIKLIEYLKESKFSGVISNKDLDFKLVNIPEAAKCYSPRHNYLWYQNKLVAQGDGTGHLYEIISTNEYKRLDSTCFEGYNFGAFNFVYKDTLFSLGGYGYWQFNGMLRYFDQKTKEWSFIPSNKSIPLRQWYSSTYYYDKKNEKLYVIYIIPQKVELKGEEENRTVYVQCLDLRDKNWWDESKKLNTDFVKNLDWLNPTYFHTPQGLISIWENDLFVLDFNDNKINKIDPLTHKSILNYLNTSNKLFLFTTKHNLNFYTIKSGSIDSIGFSSNNILKTNIPLYFNLPQHGNRFSSSKNWLVILIIVLGILLIVIFQLLRKLRLKNVTTTNETDIAISNVSPPEIIINNNTSFKENLTETEKSLFELLVTNSLEGKMTTTNQMNQVLGISKKPSKIQNNIRAVNIQMINQKFMVYSGINDNLIIKERTEFDKRFFEFAIESKYLVKVK